MIIQKREVCIRETMMKDKAEEECKNGDIEFECDEREN